MCFFFQIVIEIYMYITIPLQSLLERTQFPNALNQKQQLRVSQDKKKIKEKKEQKDKEKQT